MSESYQVVWDGTRAVSGRYLSLEFEDGPTKPAPSLPRQTAQTNRMGQIRAWFAGGRQATMREVMTALSLTVADRHRDRRIVYLLASRGHLRIVGTREARPGVVERVYGGV